MIDNHAEKKLFNVQIISLFTTSAIGAGCIFFLALTNSQSLIFPYSNSIILQNSPMLIGIWLSIFFIVLALLKIKKIVPQNYFLVSKRERARHDIIILALTLPAWILLMIDFYLIRADFPKIQTLLPILFGIVSLYYFYCFFILFTAEKS